VTIRESDLPPMSSGPSLHVHTREDEVSVVVEGVLTLQLGDQRLEVPARGASRGWAAGCRIPSRT
jgi:uncharacterized cupin superfamily protein